MNFEQQIDCLECEPEEIERLKHEIESRLPEILAILAEAIKKSGVSRNFDVELKIDTVRLESSDEPQNLASNRFSLTSKTPVSSIAIKGQQVLRASSVWHQPCPDPGIAPDGCWM